MKIVDLPPLNRRKTKLTTTTGSKGRNTTNADLNLAAAVDSASENSSSDICSKPAGNSTGPVQSQAIEQINRLHDEVNHETKLTITKAIEIGEKLTSLKEKVGHGAWSKFVEDNLDFDIRTAQRYMKVFRGRDELKNDSGVSHFTLMDAYQRLSTAKETEEAAPSSGRSAEGEKKPVTLFEYADEDTLKEGEWAGGVIPFERVRDKAKEFEKSTWNSDAERKGAALRQRSLIAIAVSVNSIMGASPAEADKREMVEILEIILELARTA